MNGFDDPAALDPVLPGVTGEAVAHALRGFALQLLPGTDIDWLAMAVRRSLVISIPDSSDGPERASNVEIHDELERLATSAGSTWLELFQRGHAANSWIRHHAWVYCDHDGEMDVADGMIMCEPPDYRRFKAAVAELDWLSRFVREAAGTIGSQSGPWRQSTEKRLRVERGQHLAPIFEAAYGRRVSANNWPSGTHPRPSAFMSFYQAMVELAFGEHAMPNISGVLKEACQLHRKQPVEFPAEIISGL